MSVNLFAFSRKELRNCLQRKMEANNLMRYKQHFNMKYAKDVKKEGINFH